MHCIHSNAEGGGICSHEFQTLLTSLLAMMSSIVTVPPSQESQLNIRTRENHNEPWRILTTLRPILPHHTLTKAHRIMLGRPKDSQPPLHCHARDTIHLTLCLPLSRNETNVSQGRGSYNSTVCEFVLFKLVVTITS